MKWMVTNSHRDSFVHLGKLFVVDNFVEQPASSGISGGAVRDMVRDIHVFVHWSQVLASLNFWQLWGDFSTLHNILGVSQNSHKFLGVFRGLEFIVSGLFTQKERKETICVSHSWYVITTKTEAKLEVQCRYQEAKSWFTLWKNLNLMPACWIWIKMFL